MAEGEKPLTDRVIEGAEKAYEATRKKTAELKRALFEQGAPEIEPECEFLLVEPNAKGEYILRIDKNGNRKIDKDEILTFKTIREYRTFLYKQQAKVLQLKKSSKEREKRKYEMQIEAIDLYIERKKEKYDEMVGTLIDAQHDFEYYRDQYNEGLGTAFYPGDEKEKWLKKKMDEATAKTRAIGGKDKFIYSCLGTDIDNPGAGERYFEDIRVLRSQYAKKMRAIGGEISELDFRLENTKAYLKRINDKK